MGCARLVKVGQAGTVLLTVGHGTASCEELSALLRDAGVASLVDVRTAPGSRRNPQFGRREMERWVAEAGIGYRWEPDLGGFRRPGPHSPNVALRHPSFRGYADYMMSERFLHALERLVAEARERSTVIMCSEQLWWRCHRRLVADAASLLFGVEVCHIGHDGRLSPHRLTEGARLDQAAGVVVYDLGAGEIPGLSTPALHGDGPATS
jgi:uncharacterized protein (DUF488 family)